MKKKNNKKAFSFIEISAVMIAIALVIGVIIAGKSILENSRLAAARNLTAFSPVNSIEGLVLWLDATSADAFDEGENIDGSLVSNWYDLNKKSLNKHDATQTGDDRPAYTKNAISNLPSLSFNGTNSYLLTTTDPAHNLGELTIFFVLKKLASAEPYPTMFATVGHSSDTGSIHLLTVADLPRFWLRSTAPHELDSTVDISDEAPVIVVCRYNSSTKTISVNGTTTSGSGNSQSGDLTQVSIGAWDNNGSASRYFAGYIGEIIVYNNTLTDDQTEDVEEYLSKKWKIKLN